MSTRPESESEQITIRPAVLFISAAVLIFLSIMSGFDHLDGHLNDQTNIIISQ